MKKLSLIIAVILLAATITACSNKGAEIAEIESETAILDAGSIQTARPAGTEEGVGISGQIPEDASYSIVLNSYDESQKMNFIGYLRENLGLNLAEAKTLSEVLPSTICENITLAKANEYAKELSSFGGITSIIDSAGNTIPNALLQTDKTYDLVLESYPADSKSAVIKYLRENLGLNLRDAKNFSENLPKTLFTGISGDKAQAAFDELTVLGAIISVSEN